MDVGLREHDQAGGTLLLGFDSLLTIQNHYQRQSLRKV